MSKFMGKNTIRKVLEMMTMKLGLILPPELTDHICDIYLAGVADAIKEYGSKELDKDKEIEKIKTEFNS